MTTEEILSHLEGVTKSGAGWMALCPAHDDGKPSLSISKGSDGRTLLKCLAGCRTEDVVAAMGLTMADLFETQPKKRSGSQKSRGRIVANYPYEDANGKLLYEKLRFDPKGFCWHHPDGKRGWLKDRGDAAPMLYRLPEILKADADDMMFVCEGEKDADALRALGLIATTNPDGAGKWNTIDDTPLHNRHIAIVGDKDAPGRAHATDVARALFAKAKSVRIVELPGENVKDAHDWVEGEKEQQEAEHERQGDPDPLWAPDLKAIRNKLAWIALGVPELTEPPAAENAGTDRKADDGETKTQKKSGTKGGKGGKDKPNLMELADEYIDEHFDHRVGPTARHWRDELYVWDGQRFIRISTNDFRKEVLVWLDENATAKPKDARDVAECIAARLLIKAEREQPVWLGGKGGPPDPADWISMGNGILDITKASRRATDALRPHTPLWFDTTTVPYPYDPDAECPAWFEFLNQVLDGDIERVNLLAEWFGLCLTPETKYQTMTILVGPRRSGKGTVLRILRRVVGEHACCDLRLGTLGELFGLWGLLGKRVAIVPDAHLSHGAEALKALEVIKSITGEDALEVHRKMLPSVFVKLQTRIVMACNELPRFGDYAGTLGPRAAIVPFTNCYEGREDRNLEERLRAELPGIFNWALWGLGRLRKNGKFTQPAASEETRREFDRLSSPVQAFVEDACLLDGGSQVTKDKLWDAWRGWCEANGHVPGSRELLFIRLRSLHPRLRSVRLRTEGSRVYVLAGIGLRREGFGAA